MQAAQRRCSNVLLPCNALEAPSGSAPAPAPAPGIAVPAIWPPGDVGPAGLSPKSSFIVWYFFEPEKFVSVEAPPTGIFRTAGIRLPAFRRWTAVSGRGRSGDRADAVDSQRARFYDIEMIDIERIRLL